MLRATLKSLLSRKARLVLSSLAVLIGVAFVSGTMVLSESLNNSIRNTIDDAYSTSDVVVRDPDTDAASSGPEVPNLIPAQAIPIIEELPDVADVTASIGRESVVDLIKPNGKVASGGFGAPTVAQNWTGEDELIELREGAEPVADNEIAISASMADATDYGVGDSVPVYNRVSSEQGEYTITGIFGYSGDRDSLFGEKGVAFTTPEAQRLLLAGQDGYTEVTITSSGNVSDEQLRDEVAAAVGTDLKVQTGQEASEETSQQVEEALSIFTYVLLGFGFVTVFVSVFLIINTFSIIVAQRTRELALLRAIGGSRRQMINSVLVEALVVGLIATILGFAGGIGLGYLLSGLMGGDLDVSLQIPVSAIILATIVGVGVTMLAALFPAVRASRVPPVAAMREAATPDRPLTKVTIAGLAVLTPGLVSLIVGLTGTLGGDGTLWTILLGVFLCFIGVALLTPILARPVVSAIGQLMSWSMPGKLGKRNSGRNPRRTAITSSALMIGVALVTGIGVVLSSFEASFADILENDTDADLVVSGSQNSEIPPTFAADKVDQIRNVSGVAGVADLFWDEADVNGDESYVYASSDMAAYLNINGAVVVDGDTAGFGPNDLLVNESRAEDDNLAVGDTVEIQYTGADAPQQYTLKAIIEDSVLTDGWTATADHVDEFSITKPVYAFIHVTDGADIDAVQADVEQVIADEPEVTVNNQQEFLDQQTESLDFIIVAIQILLGLAMVIAIIGVINTLVLSVLERTRELGLLRAVGMTRGQVTRMVTVESVVISLFGALMGIAVGIGLGTAMQQALEGEGIRVLSLPWSTIITYLIAAAVIGVLAAILPSIRAAKLNVLNAIAYE